MKKHLIIGCGPAGLSAAEEIRRVSAGDEIRIVSAEDHAPYSPTILPYVIAGKIAQADIALRKKDYFDSIKAAFVPGKKVVRVATPGKEVVYEDGSREGYATMLIASGAESTRPRIKGLRQSDYLGFHTIADCRRLVRQLRAKKNVAILGAGLVGMGVAAGLTERGCRVTVIEKEPGVLPLYFDPEAQSVIANAFTAHNVQLRAGKEVLEARKANAGMEVGLSDGTAISADVLVVCTGVRPRTSFLEGSGIAVDRGIVVDRTMMTAVKDVYAAGDVAAAPDFFTGQPGLNQIVLSAVDGGRVAGANMAGVPTEYGGWISCNIFHFFGNTAFSAGLAMPKGEGHEIVSDRHGTQFKKLVYRDDRLVGAMFVNTDLDPGVILYLIEKKVDLGAHKEALFEQPEDTGRWLMLQSEHREAALV